MQEYMQTMQESMKTMRAMGGPMADSSLKCNSGQWCPVLPWLEKA